MAETVCENVRQFDCRYACRVNSCSRLDMQAKRAEVVPIVPTPDQSRDILPNSADKVDIL
eukprot:2197267-Amphidinium_carterae.2